MLVLFLPNSHLHLFLSLGHSCRGRMDTNLPVKGGVLHQGVCISILNDHLTAHTGKALWVVLELPGHL